MSRTKRVYFNTQKVVTTEQKGWVEVDLDYTQFYQCLGKAIASLNSIMAVKLLCWAFGQMNKENMFSINQLKIEEFNDWLKENGGKTYNSRSIYNALKELISNKIVLKWSNSSYQIDPLHIWSDSVEKRIQHLQEKGMHDSYQLIEEPITEYKPLKSNNDKFKQSKR